MELKEVVISTASPLSFSVTLTKYFLMIPLVFSGKGGVQLKCNDRDIRSVTIKSSGGEDGAKKDNNS